MLLTLTVGLCQKKTRGLNKNSTIKSGQLRNTFEPQRHMDKHVSVSKPLNQLHSWGNQNMKGNWIFFPNEASILPFEPVKNRGPQIFLR